MTKFIIVGIAILLLSIVFMCMIPLALILINTKPLDYTMEFADKIIYFIWNKNEYK